MKLKNRLPALLAMLAAMAFAVPPPALAGEVSLAGKKICYPRGVQTFSRDGRYSFGSWKGTWKPEPGGASIEIVGVGHMDAPLSFNGKEVTATLSDGTTVTGRICG
jgi:hypothetical protein